MGWKEQENGYNNGSAPSPNSPSMTDHWAGQNRRNAESYAARMAASSVPDWSPLSSSGSVPSGDLGGLSYRPGGRMDLNGFQLIMFLLGFPVGFVVGVLPFFIRGLGFYSFYPKLVGFETGILGALILWALSLATKRGGRYLAGALTILIFAFLVARVMPTPFLELYKSLLRTR